MTDQVGKNDDDDDDDNTIIMLMPASVPQSGARLLVVRPKPNVAAGSLKPGVRGALYPRQIRYSTPRAGVLAGLGTKTRVRYCATVLPKNKRQLG